MPTPIVRTKLDKYASSHYDENFCLKPPLPLWLVLLYLSRAITLPMAVAIGSYAGVNSDAIALCRGLWSENVLIPSVMAGAVLIALCWRTPSAPALIRWIWARGRIFLVLAACIDLVLELFAALRPAEIYDQSSLPWFAAAIDLAVLVYLVAAKRVGDTFADFPDRAGR
jgi:Protein of unknown function (DUF2919)